MRHAKRLGAAALASSVSLLTTFGLAEAISVSQKDPVAAPTGGVNGQTATSAGKGPSRILVIRRSLPSADTTAAGTIYVQVPATAPLSGAPAPGPPAPVTRSS